MNLINVLKQINKEIYDLKMQHKQEIEKINEKYDKRHDELVIAYNVNYEMNTSCLECQGTGRIQYDDGYQRSVENCNVCKGTGKIIK